ncbi:MAG: serine hydrolase domain-containing protein [Anaeromyxobacter sp.]
MRFALLFFFSGCAAIAPRPAIVHYSSEKQPEFEALVRTLESEMQKNSIPGGSIAIVENGVLTHAAGIGLRNRFQPEGMTADTTFRIASISKTVLGLAALSLVDSGELDLDKKVSDYVPSFFAPITVRQALTHSSGLADKGDSHCPVGEGALDAWLAKYAPDAVWAPPGVIWNYANPNFAIVATVIEHITGKPFETVVEERVFRAPESPRRTTLRKHARR